VAGAVAVAGRPAGADGRLPLTTSTGPTTWPSPRISGTHDRVWTWLGGRKERRLAPVGRSVRRGLELPARAPRLPRPPPPKVGRSRGWRPCTQAVSGALIDHAGVERTGHRYLGSRQPPSPMYLPAAARPELWDERAQRTAGVDELSHQRLSAPVKPLAEAVVPRLQGSWRSIRTRWRSSSGSLAGAGRWWGRWWRPSRSRGGTPPSNVNLWPRRT